MSSDSDKSASPHGAGKFKSQLTEAALAEYIDRFVPNPSDPNSVLPNQTKYAATGHIVGAIANEVRLYVTDSPKAQYHGIGAGALGGVGKWWGHLYTDDIERVYRDSLAFEVTFANVLLVSYMKIIFFDGHSKMLGHFHGGGMAIGFGEAGGQGHWTRG